MCCSVEMFAGDNPSGYVHGVPGSDVEREMVSGSKAPPLSLSLAVDDIQPPLPQHILNTILLPIAASLTELTLAKAARISNLRTLPTPLFLSREILS
jgi:hypothetical protein